MGNIQPQKRYKKYYGAGILVLMLFIVWTILVSQGVFQEMDEKITQGIVAGRMPGLNTLAEAITYMGNWEATTAVCLLLLLFDSTYMKLGVPATAVALITQVIKMVVKPIIARPRPDQSFFLIEQGGYSFPSGHAIATFSVYVIIAMLLWHYYRNGEGVGKEPMSKAKTIALIALCAFLAIAIGMSRVYVGVHYMSDVMGGWIAALGTLLLVYGAVLHAESDPKKFNFLRKHEKALDETERLD